MKIKDAVVIRFQDICAEKNIKYNELATRAGITPSTVYSMMDSRRRELSIITIKRLCDGLDISLCEFFNDEIFSNLDLEI